MNRKSFPFGKWMNCGIDIIVEAKLQKFSQHFHKSYQSVKLFSHVSFVAYGNFEREKKLLKRKEMCYVNNVSEMRYR